MTTILSGPIFSKLNAAGDYGPDLQDVATKTVSQLLEIETHANAPGMLLGMVQSGKTRAFLGVVACAFDSGFDVAVILTKGTVALSTQTVKRLNRDLKGAVDSELLHIHDVMQLPTGFTQWEANQKTIFVVKKQTDNLDRLRRALLEKDFLLSGKRVLFIDDEADWASVGFKRTKGQIDLAKIAFQIDQLRQDLAAQAPPPAFLQVTATPYSLYLQPESVEINGQRYQRTRPSFTVLVPVHNRYIGGEFFFDDDHPLYKVGSRCYSVIESQDELTALKRPDARRVKPDNVLEKKAVDALRRGVASFIAAGSLRRWQQLSANQRQSRYSFIVHTETNKPSHKWQSELVQWIVTALRDPNQAARWKELFGNACDDLEVSLAERERLPEWAGQKFDLALPMPGRSEWLKLADELLHALVIQVVNSEQDVITMLDDDGQLKLTNPLNIFVGGQILDRGITVSNLIGFYYGRNPNKFQQDTVLQHARLFGARAVDDLLVTRFYTTDRIHSVMTRIHEIDTALRGAFEREGHAGGVVFIQRDNKSEIIPCSPNKIALSTTATLRPHKRRLAFGFQTRMPKRDTLHRINRIDVSVEEVCGHPVAGDHDGEKFEPVLVDVKVADAWLKDIEGTLSFEGAPDFDWNAMRSALRYIVSQPENPHTGKLWLIVRTNRDVPRTRRDGGVVRFTNSPDTSQREGKIARELSSGHTPTLMMLRQNGRVEKGWADCPFWWPVLMAPKEMKPVVFAEDVDGPDEEEVDE